MELLSMSEPKHIPEYFINGNKSDVPHWCARRDCSICNPPIADATGFPFDDNTAGEELRTPVLPMPTTDVAYWEEPSEGQQAVQALGGHPDFYKYLDEMKALYSAKHYQYATDADPMINFRLCGSLATKLIKPGVNQTIAAALLLMSKQIVGVYEIVGEGKTNTIESLQDKLRDIGIYSVILQILVAETQK
jgi:hypothetical protein